VTKASIIDLFANAKLKFTGLYPGIAAHAEIWPSWRAMPKGLNAILAEQKQRVLVSVRCAVHNTLIALVLRTPSGALLLITDNGSPEPCARNPEWLALAKDAKFAAWQPQPTSLGKESQPDLYCRRCDAPRPVPDLLPPANKALRERRQDVRF
jgi:hypothetical protein